MWRSWHIAHLLAEMTSEDHVSLLFNNMAVLSGSHFALFI